MEWLKQAAEYGPLGFMCLAMGWVIIKLHLLREADRREYNQKVEELQEEKQSLITQRADEKNQMYLELVRALGDQRVAKSRSQAPETGYSHKMGTTIRRRE